MFTSSLDGAILLWGIDYASMHFEIVKTLSINALINECYYLDGRFFVAVNE
jgi:hypothetical protein